MHPVIHLFTIPIPTFGLFLLVGMAMAFLLAFFTGKKHPVTTMDMMFFGLFAIMGGIIGAKGLFFIIKLPDFFNDPLTSLTALFSGGAVFYGGLIGGILGGYAYTRIYQLNPIIFFDLAVPSLALGQAFGRIGCFFNGCCYGIAYHGPGAVIYPPGAYPPSGIGLFPTQLVESFFLFLLSGLLLLVLKKSKIEGYTTGFYLLSYGLFRFGIEYLRGDPRGSIFIFSTSQFLSLFIILFGIFFLCKLPQKLFK